MPITHLGDFSDPFNRVFIGDNLPALRALHEEQGECVDLVYLDPPFNSKRGYNFIGGISASSTALQKAFRDTWKYKPEVFNAVVEDEHLRVVERDFLRGWKEAFGVAKRAGEELAYLCHIVPRLVAIRAVMKPTASIYLHCDPSANAALRKAMDVVFGARHFRNDIIWTYGLGGSSQRQFSRKHDNILFYTKTSTYHFKKPKTASTSRAMAGKPKGMMDAWTDLMSLEALADIAPPESWGVIFNPDTWTDIPSLNNQAKERMGYPTQKPRALLRRIIEASSRPGNVVLDPYCGCGTTVAACRKLTEEKPKNERKFIGMEIEGFAAQVMRRRMHDQHGGYDLKLGYPRPEKLEDFDTLAENRAWLYYEHYAVELIPGAMPATTETKELLKLPTGGGGDKGMDGLLPMTRNKIDTCLVISVKAGQRMPSHSVRDLNGVIANENNKSVVGGILIYRSGSPTAAMLAEARGARPIVGDDGKRYPGIRILSLAELWDAKKTCGNDPQCWANRLELPLEMVKSLSADFSARPEVQQRLRPRNNA